MIARLARFVPITAALTAAAFLAGCAGSSGGATKSVAVFYTTDRARAKGAGEFTNDRAKVDAPSFGRRTIALPISRNPGTDRGARVDESVTYAEKGALYRELARTAAGSSPSDLLVYVHGYNTEFAGAARRAAVYATDLGQSRPQPFGVVFCWPSRAHLLGYLADKDSAELAQPHLSRLIRDCRRQPGLRDHRLLLVGHSMGCRLLCTALVQQYFYDGYYLPGHDDYTGRRRLPPMCDYLVLIEPDIDLHIFQRQIHLLSPLCKRIVVYQSRRDRAIAASTFVHTYPRVGNRPGGLENFKNVEFVNITTEKTDFLGHSYDHPGFIEQLAKRLAAPPATSLAQVSGTTLTPIEHTPPADVRRAAQAGARSEAGSPAAAARVTPPCSDIHLSTRHRPLAPAAST